MAAHCLYRTVFVVGAVLARLVHFLLGWCSSAWLVHLRQVHPLRGAVLARLVHFLLGWCT